MRVYAGILQDRTAATKAVFARLNAMLAMSCPFDKHVRLADSVGLRIEFLSVQRDTHVLAHLLDALVALGQKPARAGGRSRCRWARAFQRATVLPHNHSRSAVKSMVSQNCGQVAFRRAETSRLNASAFAISIATSGATSTWISTMRERPIFAT